MISEGPSWRHCVRSMITTRTLQRRGKVAKLSIRSLVDKFIDLHISETLFLRHRKLNRWYSVEESSKNEIKATQEPNMVAVCWKWSGDTNATWKLMPVFTNMRKRQDGNASPLQAPLGVESPVRFRSF